MYFFTIRRIGFRRIETEPSEVVTVMIGDTRRMRWPRIPGEEWTEWGWQSEEGSQFHR